MMMAFSRVTSSMRSLLSMAAEFSVCASGDGECRLALVVHTSCEAFGPYEQLPAGEQQLVSVLAERHVPLGGQLVEAGLRNQEPVLFEHPHSRIRREVVGFVLRQGEPCQCLRDALAHDCPEFLGRGKNDLVHFLPFFLGVCTMAVVTAVPTGCGAKEE